MIATTLNGRPAEPTHWSTRLLAQKLVNVDFSSVADRLLQGIPLPVGHMVPGNRVRHSGAIRLQPDLEWREKLGEEDRRAFWRRAGWLARYGYQT